MIETNSLLICPVCTKKIVFNSYLNLNLILILITCKVHHIKYSRLICRKITLKNN